MPNFDGNGPLKRGRVIGRGRGPCRNDDRISEGAIPEPGTEKTNTRKTA